MDPSADAALAALLAELARELARHAPPPRGLPGFGMEWTLGAAPACLEELAAHGLFRKYGLVCVPGDVAGGTARWLAGGRLGCRAVVPAPSADAAGAARVVTRRAGLAGQVHHVVTATPGVPLAAARCTHVWLVEALPRLGDAAAALAAATPVLRPGGWLALQEPVGAAGPVAVAGWSLPDTTALEAAVRAAGCVDVVVRDVTALAGERPAAMTAARDRLLERLDARPEPALRVEAARRRALEAARRDGTLRLVQLLARKP